jgi:hypothetical protein
MNNEMELQTTVVSVIQEVKPNFREEALAEQLDSLHRIFVVEKLEEKLQISARSLLFDRRAWQCLDSLVSAVEERLLGK